MVTMISKWTCDISSLVSLLPVLSHNQFCTHLPEWAWSRSTYIGYCHFFHRTPVILYHTWDTSRCFTFAFMTLQSAYLSGLTSHTLSYPPWSSQTLHSHIRALGDLWFPPSVTLSPKTVRWLIHSLCSFPGTNITSSEKHLLSPSLKSTCHSSSSFLALLFFKRVLFPEIPLYIFVPFSHCTCLH